MIELQATERLVQVIERELGRKLLPQVREAFLHVPRHFFVEQYYEQQGNSLSWDVVEAIPEKVYRDEALVTQIDEHGRPSSSSSQPSVMAVQLEALALEPGQRVLEIGVGTGYNAALMGKIVDDTGQIISIDIDECLVEQARQNFTRAGGNNVVAVTGDGFFGEADYAPYDRMLTTCSVRCIPRAWVDQLKTGGVLVGNWLTHLASLFIRVEKTGIGELDGGFLDLTATYMEMHSKESQPLKQKVDWTPYDARTATRIPLPNIKNLLQNPAYGLLLQCFLPEMRKRYRSRDDQIQLYLLMQDTAVLVQDDELLVTGEQSVGWQIQQSLDLYFHLGQPQIKDYHVIFQQQQAIIAIADRCFHLPLPSCPIPLDNLGC